jgi:phosphohistidine phosphatase
MRSLTLLRHAKSSWDDESLDDFHRPLNDRGRRAAQAMGRHLAAKGAQFDLVLASPAQRVVETLEGLAAGGWEAGPVEFDPAIYHASTRDLLEMVRTAPGKVQRLMLVGHNPVLGMLALQLSEDDGEGLRAQVAENYPTGALAEIALDIEGWGNAGPQCGRLVEFTLPRSLPGA